jgi:sigma-B regulation protein RsbU (phosphoserine phosphatase)
MLVLFMLYQLFSVIGWVPSSTVVYQWGFACLGTGMYIWVIRRFRNEKREEARREAELEAARELQFSMLPHQVPQYSPLDIAWHMETATEVGGDYYDYVLAEEGTLTVILGDATGHGMNTGVVVIGTKSLFHTFADAPSITDSLRIMSKSLKNMNLPHMGMAMTFLRVKDQTCTVSSAGCPP